MLQKQLVHKVNKMVLENLTDDSEKSNPMGMEAPYSDWQVVNDDLVNYQDKDARGLTFGFSLVRMADNDAMKKYVSVYQKPDDDGSGAYVVVSMSPNNPNDVRVYEISNTAYGNEPEDPKIFMQKVIEMADGSGMLRSDDYGIIEIAEDEPYGYRNVSVNKQTSTGKVNDMRGKSTVTYRNKGREVSTTNSADLNGLSNNNNSLIGRFKDFARNIPGGQTLFHNQEKSASLQKNYAQLQIEAKGEKVANTINDIYEQSKIGIFGKKTPLSEQIISKGDKPAYDKNKNVTTIKPGDSNKEYAQPVKNGTKSTTEQLGSKNGDEYPTPYKQRNVKGRTALNTLKGAGLGFLGGVGNALLNSANGQQANLATVGKATVAGAAGGYYLGKKNAEKENANAKKQATSEDVAKINAMTSVYNKKKNVNIHDKEAYDEKMGRFDESNPDIRKAKIKARASTEGTRVKKGKYKKQEVEIGLDNRNISEKPPM